MNCRKLFTITQTRYTSSHHNSNIAHVHSSNHILDYDLFTPATQQKDSKIPPMIFLHGLLGNRKNNRSAAKLLSDQLQTPFIVPDLRNHGTSFHGLPMNNKSMSDDISNLIESLPSTIPRHRGFVILGHSMGAKIAMIHALRYPKLIKGSIAIDNIPYDNSEDSYVEFEKFHIGLHCLDWCVNKHPDWTLPDLKAYLMKWVEPNEKVVNFWLTNIINKNGHLIPKVPFDTLNKCVEDIMQWKMQEFGDLEPLAGQKDVGPLLIISGNYSKFVGKDIHTHAITKYFQNFEVKPVDAGHWLVTERKLEFVKIVKEWALTKFGS
ncbi:hypothetical protein C6P40_001214 [Pichia californica]|uniref:AB hydrolase-1 domain-containing protein n=1 Tax=Pichia californica TaxID=460514 RepID=A0A9P6WLD0_9ASCO|nr:hypothetical protein C6P42_000619 [[Candida] californica]KAG0688237.1 hypothetical protein C6P40_001214 [[Candida] californica]